MKTEEKYRVKLFDNTDSLILTKYFYEFHDVIKELENTIAPKAFYEAKNLENGIWEVKEDPKALDFII